MEWREQSAVSCDEAYVEARRWIEAVTKKKFRSNDFRSALENGVLLCDLINKIKPGIIKRVNRLPTPIAGLDNLNVFLKACGKLGLKEAQLFHPGDLQDLSTRVTVKHQETNRRLKNVLITIFWLGRRAKCDHFYDGPYLNFKAFEGLLGTALYKALQETSSQKGSNVRDSGFGDSWYSEREELHHPREGGGGGGSGHKRDDSLDSLDSLGSRPHSISSDTTLKGSSEGCCSDTEADSVFRMADKKDNISYRRTVSITPKVTTPFNQFLPTKDKSSGYVPAPLRKKRAERNDDNRRSWANPTYAEEESTLTSGTRLPSDCASRASQSAVPADPLQWAYEYDSGSDSDADRPDPDLVLDDLASRRFHSPSPAPPTNFAVPVSPLAAGRASGGRGGPWPKVTMTPNVAPPQNVTFLSCGINSGESQPPQHGSVRVDHRRVVSTDSLFREIYGDSDDEDDEVGYADPVHDDLYARKMGIKPQPAGNESHDKFLPKFWTPEEDIHIQKIKLGSQRRPWYKKMQGFSHQKSGSSSDDSDCDISPWLSSAPSPSGTSPSHSHTHDASAHTTLVVGKRSKSTSDIQVDPSVLRQLRYEELQKLREQTKESDDKWQDDLSKWKNRRRSVNSDIVKKKEEREKIEQITSSSNSNRRSRTFREMQEERENKGNNSVGSRFRSLSYLDSDEDVFERPVISPRTRTAPVRSFTIDTPYFSSEPTEPALNEDKPPAASPATDRAASPPTSREVNILDSPIGIDAPTTITPTIAPTVAPTVSPTVTPTITPRIPTNITSTSHRSQSQPAAPLEKIPISENTSAVKTDETTTIISSTSAAQKVPEPRRPLLGTQAEVGAPSSGSLYKQQPQLSSMEPKPPVVSRVSASLPRSYQRSDSARLTSVVTPRPFGTQSSRLTSLPRTFTTDDSQKRVNGAVDVSKKSSVPSRYHQFMTSEDEAQSSSAHSSDEEEEEGKGETTAKSITSAQSVSSVPAPVKTEAPLSRAPAKDTSQENYCEMRISLNQKPNSSRDFGFQAAWDSTGARVTSIQPSSQAEMCQLQAGDEVLTVNRHQVAEMSYTDWKSHMEEALQEGSLVMDIRRHGKNNWDRDQPSLPFKSHKTINLTSTDHPILLGSPDKNTVNSSLDFTSHTSRETLPSKEAPAHQTIDVASNGVNGGFREEPVTMRNKDSETISLKNLKRRSEFFETGGSESAMPDIPVPSIAPSTSRWSWDPEEERRRQEKWQKEQERLLQEKYKRDQEKLQEEWLKAQQEITKNQPDQQEPESPGENSHSLSPHSPLSPISQSTTPLWEEEERKRKEEQERRRQAEERRKREEEERELQRLQEERKRRERQEEEERKRKEEEELQWQRRKEEEREEERRQQEAVEQQLRERERALQQQQQQQQQQWAGASHGFANVQPPLSHADRMKSRSTPQLDEEEKPQRRGVHMQLGGMAHWLLEEQLRSSLDKEAQSKRAASELELERRNILNAMRYREPERVTSSGLGDKKGQQPSTQAEAERQQILNEMKKKTPLLTDSSWIRQRSTTTPPTAKDTDVPPMRRGESLDNLDAYNSWRSSWTPRSNSYVQNYSRPSSALSGSTPFYGGGLGAQRPGSSTLPSSYSMGSLRGGAGTPTPPWSRQSPSPSPSSPSPTPSPEPTSEAGAPQQRSRSVSGKKICTFCDAPLGKGAAMIIESLGLCYHLSCFKCIDCKSDLGGTEAGAEVRIRNKQLYCNSCYMRFKTGQPTAM